MGQHTWQRLAWVLGLIALCSTGCSHGLSSAVRQQIDTTLSMTQLHTDPESYRDRVAMLGGDIITTQNLTDGTRVEILQKPLDGAGRPYDTDQSEGRFMAQCDTYLDPAIYAPGRQLTVAGRVLGAYTDKIGDTAYVYPLLTCLEIHLWPPKPITAYPVYSSWYWWDWWPWPGPFWWQPYYFSPYHRWYRW